MNCSQCQFGNPAEAVYCGRCGIKLLEAGNEFLSSTMTLHFPAKELAKGTILAGRFEIVERLGKGGMGTVYKVIDNKINEEMALKLLKPQVAADSQVIERFKNELKLARKIVHKNL